MKNIFNKLSQDFSKTTTHAYSTSFSFGIKTLHKRLHQPIYGIYGFVRFADEIVDTLHGHNKLKLLQNFEKDCYDAIKEKVSLNPILNSFQEVVNKYNIDHLLIDQFLKSMYMDLEKDQVYNTKKYKQYILGSAEVVGLMCLKVFTEKDTQLYKKLTPYAQKLGSAFQKVNFLRDIKSDYFELGRTYFPNIHIDQFNTETKKEIESDIEKDFTIAYEGIKMLPNDARGGVYLAYIYYLKLFLKIKKTDASKILKQRIRINNTTKLLLLTQSIFKNKLNLI